MQISYITEKQTETKMTVSESCSEDQIFVFTYIATLIKKSFSTIFLLKAWIGTNACLLWDLYI